jgi:hypothetical protein
MVVMFACMGGSLFFVFYLNGDLSFGCNHKQVEERSLRTHLIQLQQQQQHE